MHPRTDTMVTVGRSARNISMEALLSPLSKQVFETHSFVIHSSGRTFHNAASADEEKRKEKRKIVRGGSGWVSGGRA